jgi:hypothetical protein
MRYVLIFIIVASAVMAFILADHFPGFLSRYPILQDLNWTVRTWLGMDSPRPSYMTERSLKETERMLRKQSSDKGESTGKDLGEYPD